MNLKYYVDLDARKGPGCYDSEEVNFLMSRMLRGTHMAIIQECGETSSNQYAIAIAFPLSCDKGHGGLLRIFSGDDKVLGRLLRHPNIHRYVRDLDAAVLEVPSIERFAIFSRNRLADRFSPSARRRADHRLKVYGFTTPTGKKKQPGFAIASQSQSNGEAFLFRIQRLDLSAKPGPEGVGFNAYGLSKSAAVPMF
ncbi:MAG: type I-F CRISPR-associated endoribonuclease Cas6/Csy4 [Candidatus Accumulibacter sp. UW25]|jgi:CRISPR-associated endoribonuclease Cas6/Csy4 subtype I-F